MLQGRYVGELNIDVNILSLQDFFFFEMGLNIPHISEICLSPLLSYGFL